MTADIPAEQHENALALLLELLEMPDPVLAGAMFADLHSEAGAVLVSAGLLRPDGFEAVITDPFDDHDSPISLIWSAKRSSYGYFNGMAGWVSVQDERLRRYRVAVSETLSMLIAKLNRPLHGKPSPLADDLLWDMGEVRLPGRAGNVSIWFGRRLFDPGVWRVARERVRARPDARVRVLLTSAAKANLVDETLPSTTIISLWDIAATEGDLTGA